MLTPPGLGVCPAVWLIFPATLHWRQKPSFPTASPFLCECRTKESLPGCALCGTLSPGRDCSRTFTEVLWEYAGVSPRCVRDFIFSRPTPVTPTPALRGHLCSDAVPHLLSILMIAALGNHFHCEKIQGLWEPYGFIFQQQGFFFFAWFIMVLLIIFYMPGISVAHLYSHRNSAW